MSTILKALRRLEEDKRAQAAISLEHAVQAPAARSRRRSLGSGAAAGVVGSVGVIAIAWSLSDLWATREVSATPVAAPIREASVAPPAPVRIVDAPRPPPTTPVRLIATRSPREPLVAPEPEPEPEPAAAPTPPPVAKLPPVAAKPPPVVVVEPSAAVAKPRALAPQPETVAAQPSVVSKPAVSKLPAVRELPSLGLAVQEIIWHPTRDRRVAVLAVEGEAAPRRLAEGEEVAGFTVARIGLADVELVRNGVTTRRRVGAR